MRYIGKAYKRYQHASRPLAAGVFGDHTPLAWIFAYTTSWGMKDAKLPKSIKRVARVRHAYLLRCIARISRGL